MIASWSAWFRGRSRREQWLILVMLSLFVLIFAWLLIVRPLDDALSAARERHGDSVVALAEAKAAAAQIGRLEKVRPEPLTGGLEATITQAAGDAGFRLSRIQPESDGSVTVAIDAARPQALFAWVSAMEAGRGMIVRQLNATSNSDKTLAAQVTLRARAGS